MKTVTLASLNVGDFFYVRILGNSFKAEHASIPQINLAGLSSAVKFKLENEQMVRMVKTSQLVHAQVHCDEDNGVFTLDPNAPVLVPDGESKPASGDVLDTYIENTSSMVDFSDALRLMTNKGVAVRRNSWPTGAMVFLELGSHDDPENGMCPTKILDVPIELFENGDKGTTTRLPNFKYHLRNVSVRGWTPTQHDMLARDWQVVRPESV